MKYPLIFLGNWGLGGGRVGVTPSGVRPPPPFYQQASGQIFKDDVNGFSSIQNICFMYEKYNASLYLQCIDVSLFDHLAPCKQLVFEIGIFLLLKTYYLREQCLVVDLLHVISQCLQFDIDLFKTRYAFLHSFKKFLEVTGITNFCQITFITLVCAATILKLFFAFRKSRRRAR